MIEYINLQQAISNLLSGKIVAIPTETVYGLAANIHNEAAIQNIFTIKNRPITHPLIVHIHNNFDIERYAQINNLAQKIINTQWPAPLTIILGKTSNVSNLITGNQNTVALRCPNHELTQSLLKEVGCGVAAPSANRFGYISPSKAEHVYQEFSCFNYDISILDGGECEIGIESSIIKIDNDDNISILRHGMFDVQIFSNIANITDLTKININIHDNGTNTIKVSGNLPVHYAPSNNLYILKPQNLLDTINKSNDGDVFIIFENSSNILKLIEDTILARIKIIYMPNLATKYAHNIYNSLREADNYTYETHNIYLEQIPSTIEWQAIQDRINKASYKFINKI